MRVQLTGHKKDLKKELVLKAVQFIRQALKKRSRPVPAENALLTIAFLSEKSMKGLNRTFRDTDRVTDVLSFSPVEEGGLGELALCIPKMREQARREGLTLEEEAFYLILHGILHLLGYEHEKGGKKAREMFTLQDSIFEEWRNCEGKK